MDTLTYFTKYLLMPLKEPCEICGRSDGKHTDPDCFK